MSSTSTGLLHRTVADTPVAVIDFETTGVRAGSDRVVEVAVVRIEPGKPPELVVDSLVNPDRPVVLLLVHRRRKARFARDAHHEYWDALQAVLSDFSVSDDEIIYLEAKKRELGLTVDEIRSLHGRAFASTISECVEDKRLDDAECLKLQRLRSCLQQLGWAPGDGAIQNQAKKKRPFWRFW